MNKFKRKVSKSKPNSYFNEFKELARKITKSYKDLIISDKIRNQVFIDALTLYFNGYESCPKIKVSIIGGKHGVEVTTYIPKKVSKEIFEEAKNGNWFPTVQELQLFIDGYLVAINKIKN